MKSISYVDNRKFADNYGLPPGPYVYEASLGSKAIYIVPNLMFVLNNWLADGVLVSSTLDSVAQVPDVGCLPSSTVAVLFTPRITGPSPFHP